jgi:hypothetical protein
MPGSGHLLLPPALPQTCAEGTSSAAAGDGPRVGTVSEPAPNPTLVSPAANSHVVRSLCTAHAFSPVAR